MTDSKTVTRSLTVRGALAGFQVKQHLELHGISFTEDQRARESTFTVEATDAQWAVLNEYAEKVQG